MQPPSGGCVLKRSMDEKFVKEQEAAAFGRLCVETNYCRRCFGSSWAAAFGRLCVETFSVILLSKISFAAAFGRLCVET